MHFYNNQFIGTTDYAMNTRANAYIYSEYNLFFMTKNPMDVRSGAIKSYNDSFSSCIGSMTGTVVTDKSTKVSSGNKYENFDTNASLSYIPSGDYQLQVLQMQPRFLRPTMDVCQRQLRDQRMLQLQSVHCCHIVHLV